MMSFLFRSLTRLLIPLWLAASGTPAGAAAPAAPVGELGMKAPALEASEWIQGPEFKLGTPGDTNIYVVEFWATWCGPCRVSIPELNKLHDAYKDKGLVIVGISDEEPAKVREFLKDPETRMKYRVALDPEHKIAAAYRLPFGSLGIPHAFVVGRDGTIVWEGNPMLGLDKAVAEVFAGTYDIGAAKAQRQLEKDFQSYFTLVSTVGRSPESDRLGRAVVDSSTNRPGVLFEFTRYILTDPRLRHRDLKLALEASRLANTVTSNTEPVLLTVYAQALAMNSKSDEAIQIQQTAIDKARSPEDRKVLEGIMEELKRSRPSDK